MKYLFLLGVTVGTSLFLGPGLLKQAFLEEDVDLKKSYIESINVDYLNQTNRNYIRFDVKLDNRNYKKVYYLIDGEHIHLIKLIQKLAEIDDEKSVYTLLPIYVNDLNVIASYKIGNKGTIEKLKIYDTYIIGRGNSTAKRIAMGLVGGLMIVLGISLFFLGTVFTVRNLIVYFKTGQLPALPNMVENMSNGIKFLLGESYKDKK
ncbi:hypothetical protein [Fulvivirga sediminis]|uniref:Uncharacterized protein n=1 Tax=Fulvivirga sediminis TaxID=2803949 RepID=A0A937FAB4_9BACT|nr:hypothetical protein [Fulvivirga sediminis]MBL3656923.1 hypothetical protein [Fulvivirga sediminis]